MQTKKNTNKSQSILYLYDSFNDGKTVFTQSALSELKITRRTFLRYISEINIYFINNKPWKEIRFNNAQSCYVMENNKI